MSSFQSMSAVENMPWLSPAKRARSWIFALTWALAFSSITTTAAAQALTGVDANSIMRYQFSTDTFDAVEAEFNEGYSACSLRLLRQLRGKAPCAEGNS